MSIKVGVHSIIEFDQASKETTSKRMKVRNKWLELEGLKYNIKNRNVYNRPIYKVSEKAKTDLRLMFITVHDNARDNAGRQKWIQQ